MTRFFLRGSGLPQLPLVLAMFWAVMRAGTKRGRCMAESGPAFLRHSSSTEVHLEGPSPALAAATAVADALAWDTTC